MAEPIGETNYRESATAALERLASAGRAVEALVWAKIIDLHQERVDLACVVADAWCADRMAARCADIFENHPELAKALDSLDNMTRTDPRRKVLP